MTASNTASSTASNTAPQSRQTISDIAESLGLSKSTVRRAARHLTQSGLVHASVGERNTHLFDNESVALIIAELGGTPTPKEDSAVLRVRCESLTAQLHTLQTANETLREANLAQAEQITQMQTLIDQGQRLLAAEQQAHANDNAKLSAPRQSWFQKLLGIGAPKSDSNADRPD